MNNVYSVSIHSSCTEVRAARLRPRTEPVTVCYFCHVTLSRYFHQAQPHSALPLSCTGTGTGLTQPTPAGPEPEPGPESGLPTQAEAEAEVEAEAEGLYRAVLAAEPAHVPALTHLATLIAGRGGPDEVATRY
jgi:hypothetical protein